MENLKDKIGQLLNKAEWTDKEKLWLHRYLENNDAEELRRYMEQQFEDEKNKFEKVDSEMLKEMLQDIHEKIGVGTRRNRAPVVKIWVLKIAAASFIGLLVSTTYLFWFTNNTKREIAETKFYYPSNRNNFSQGGNKALLTLGDGSTIVLDNKQDGFLSQQGNTKVFKLGEKLVYDSKKESRNEILYNKVSTGAGGQYQIELQDGTMVWLNAASTLYFPTAFSQEERRVEVKGEAYFEVAKDPVKPFKVKVNEAEVQVLGTHFNVMAYENEVAVKTTLLEGTVKFVKGDYKWRLEPGQQTQLAKDGLVKVISGVNVSEVLAWKNGMFDFEGASIASVSKQLSRWYDVDITFDKKITDLFHAKIPRNTKLFDVLKALELTGKVRFQMEGKKIIAKP